MQAHNQILNRMPALAILAALPILALSVGAARAQVTYNPVVNNGEWTTAATWNPTVAGGPGSLDSILFNGASAIDVRLNGAQANTYTIANVTSESSLAFRIVTLSGSGNSTLTIGNNLVSSGGGNVGFALNSGAILAVTANNISVSNSGSRIGIGATGSGLNITANGFTTVGSGASIFVGGGSQATFAGGMDLQAGGWFDRGRPSGGFTAIGGLTGSGTMFFYSTDANNRIPILDFIQSSGVSTYTGNIDASSKTTSGTIAMRLQRGGSGGGADGAQILRGSIENNSGETTINGGVLAFAGSANLTTGNIRLNNSRAGVGSILGLGTGNLSRSLGTGDGEIRLEGTAAGFAAYDADRSVTLGAGGLTWSGTNFSMGTLALGHSSATHRIELTNAIDLGAVTRTVQVGNGAAAVDGRLSGLLSGGGGLTVTGGGVLELTGNNSYAGATTVNVGGLLINGAHSGAGTVTVADGAWLGGNGSLAGSLTLNEGARLVFDPATSLTLAAANNVSIHNTFGVASLVDAAGLAIDWALIATGTYSLLAGTTTNFSGIQNFGIDNAESIGGGRQAYFENGSLQLVVIPEPGTLMLMGLGGAALLLSRLLKR